MKKVVFVLALALAFFSCDNDSVEKQEAENLGPNPYPDGVYPFEVSNVGHTENGGNYTVTWTTPDGVSRVTVEMFMIVNKIEEKVYLLDPPNPSFGFRDFVLKKDSFSFYTYAGNDKYATIICVDKFGNVSKGVKYDFDR